MPPEPTDATQPLISLIILAHNKVGHTRRCLHGLLQSSYRPFEILALDNGSTDPMPQLFDQFAPAAHDAGVTFRPRRIEENAGAVTGRNLLLADAAGDYIVLLDNDIVPRTRSWMERLRAELDSNPALGIVGPKLIYPSPPYRIQFAGGAVTPTGWVQFCGRGDPRDAPQWNQPRDVQCLISACWMMPKTLHQKLGPLDEQFNPLQFEDIDYCYRARDAGYRVRYLPSVEMYHFENVTSDGTATINYKYVTIKNGMKFKRKWRHMFATEGGPPDAEVHWADIPKHTLSDIGELEVVE
jgi:GT2 family glycosyltransferase